MPTKSIAKAVAAALAFLLASFNDEHFPNQANHSARHSQFERARLSLACSLAA